MKRVNNPAKYLINVVEPDQEYYIGFGSAELTQLAKSHPEIKSLLDGVKSKVVISGKSGVLKENVKGKFVRKQPEKKTSIWKHIEYYSNKWEKWIEYDREFSIWEKEMLHQFNLELTVRKTPQGETIFTFPKFKMENDAKHFLLAGAAMNMACALSNYFLPYNAKLQPIIPVTKFVDRSLLPSGQNYNSVKDKLDTIEKILNSENNVESTGNSYRFALLKEKSPTEVTMGTGGFDEYLRFEFKEHDILILENLKTGNATFVFRLSKFDFDKTLDKQTAVKDPSFMKRIIHDNMEAWAAYLARFF
ncbi:MAG: hypothetical protein EOO07_10060 [Chitinophagaceae bacterium]|nr:MAG: hypothetical protein EOO07_10060 [Chitinophagaceae bacterium]